MVHVGCSLDSFSIFLLSLKQQQNLMKIMFSSIHFPTWLYPPQIMTFKIFYTGKLYGVNRYGMIMHKLKLMCTEYEVIHWKHVEDSIFVSGFFVCRPVSL